MSNSFILRLQNIGLGKPPGSFVMSASPLIAEALAHCGFEWLIMDAEHSPLDLIGIVHMLQAVQGTAAHPIVRVPWNDPVTIKRVLDAGADTLLVPFVETAAQARAAVSASRYPPQGTRGMAGLSRASQFGARLDHFQTANQRQATIAQLETPQALEKLEDIAAVDGIDALFIGPTDLSGAMGLYGQAQHADVQHALADAARRCRQIGIPVGTVGGTPAAVRTYQDMGFDFVGLGSDLSLLVATARQGMATLRPSPSAAHGTATAY
jgi:2-keto-3-deoxy-L-rhamnonate aldolase RhmA